MIHVSFQGERGAYSEAAAKTFFDEEIETIPYATFAEVLESTSNDKTEYSILPVENSIEGSVGESYDLLYSTNLNATGEIYHRIEPERSIPELLPVLRNEKAGETLWFHNILELYENNNRNQ